VGAVLVTGGAGFVGTYVARDLLSAGERVVVFDQAIHGNALELVLPGYTSERRLTLATGPITDGWTILRLCREQDVDRIVHLAAPLTQAVAAGPAAGVRDICGGTATVFEIATAIGARKVVWASSTAVFGSRADYPAGPLANDAAHHPLSLYGACKSLCERMAVDYRQRDDVDSVGLRFSVVFGPGRLRGYMSFPSDLIREVAMGESVEMPIADEPIHWQYVEEVAAVVIAALGARRTSDIVFNPCGDSATFRRVGEILARLAPEAKVTFSPTAADEGQRALLEIPFEYDDSEFCNQVGYEKRFSFEDGVAASYHAFRSLVTST
jgi:UDP-glucose 4-epimerase